MFHDKPTSEPQATRDERYKPVTMFARYSGAWSEYNVRISARQSITQIWFAGLPLLLAASFSPQSKADRALLLIATFSVPVANLLHSCLMYMHDAMMARLHAFMVECEEYMNGDRQMPGYHADERRGYLGIRKVQTYTFIVISAVVAAVAYLPLASHGAVQDGSGDITILHIMYVVISIVAPYFHLKSIKCRQDALVPRPEQIERRISELEALLRASQNATRASEGTHDSAPQSSDEKNQESPIPKPAANRRRRRGKDDENAQAEKPE